MHSTKLYYDQQQAEYLKDMPWRHRPFMIFGWGFLLPHKERWCGKEYKVPFVALKL